MASHLFGAIELALVFGGVVAFGLWELHATRRDRRESQRREAAGKPADVDDAASRD